MANATQSEIGAVVSLWRYPVKSMMHNQAKVGVYAGVLRGGTIRRGDRVRLE